MGAERETVKYARGERVRAFHPAEFGVVREGTVVGVGRVYARIDFGPMRGGTWRVVWRHVVGRAS